MDNKPEVIDPSELLTLCMPTYNRVVNVCEALEDIIPKINSIIIESVQKLNAA